MAALCASLDMLAFMWSSSIGDSTALRFVALAGALIAICFQGYQRYMRVVLAAIVIVLAYSFTLTGHLAEQGLLAKWMLVLHLLAVGWWIGALYPLKLCCNDLSNSKLYEVMNSFGKQAMVVVALLLVMGLVLAVDLVASFNLLLASNYGRVALLKLMLVAIILAIAARNKFLLVANIRQGKRDNLKQSIQIEIVVALALLIATSELTTLVGPSN